MKRIYWSDTKPGYLLSIKHQSTQNRYHRSDCLFKGRVPSEYSSGSYGQIGGPIYWSGTKPQFVLSIKNGSTQSRYRRSPSQGRSNCPVMFLKPWSRSTGCRQRESLKMLFLLQPVETQSPFIWPVRRDPVGAWYPLEHWDCTRGRGILWLNGPMSNKARR